MDYQSFIKPYLLILIPTLYIVGLFIKKSRIKNKYIPIILGALGIVLAALIIFTTESVSSTSEVIAAAVMSFIQGVLCAGAAVYGDQLIKQAHKGDDDA